MPRNPGGLIRTPTLDRTPCCCKATETDTNCVKIFSTISKSQDPIRPFWSPYNVVKLSMTCLPGIRYDVLGQIETTSSYQCPPPSSYVRRSTMTFPNGPSRAFQLAISFHPILNSARAQCLFVFRPWSDKTRPTQDACLPVHTHTRTLDQPLLWSMCLPC